MEPFRRLGSNRVVTPLIVTATFSVLVSSYTRIPSFPDVPSAKSVPLEMYAERS